MSYFNQIKLDTSNAAGDAFGRLRTSQSRGLHDAQLTKDLQPLIFEQNTNGSGASITHDATNRMALMTFASTPTGGFAYMQSFEHYRYTAGKSQLVFITFNYGAGVTNVIKFAGYSDGTNGIEFQLAGTQKQFVLYSGTGNGNQTILQANWNVDKLDGTGPSGLTLDTSKVQILVIDFQALYVGKVRIGFDIDGMVVIAHEFKHANNITTPYIQTANLPIRVGMSCTGTVNATMNFICSSVNSEDGSDTAEGYHFAAEGTVTAANGALTHLLSIQPRLTFNSIANRTKFVLENIEIIVTGTNSIKWDLVLGDVLTGTNTFTNVNATYSAFDFNTSGITSGAPAIVIASGYVGASNTVKGVAQTSTPFKYPICLDAAGAVRANGRLTLLVTGLGGTSACRGSITWKELR